MESIGGSLCHATSRKREEDEKENPNKSDRLKYSPEQRKQLEEVFARRDVIDRTLAQRLAEQFSVSVRQIRTWFQNKRAKCRRDEMKRSGRSYFSTLSPLPANPTSGATSQISSRPSRNPEPLGDISNLDRLKENLFAFLEDAGSTEDLPAVVVETDALASTEDHIELSVPTQHQSANPIGCTSTAAQRVQTTIRIDFAPDIENFSPPNDLGYFLSSSPYPSESGSLHSSQSSSCNQYSSALYGSLRHSYRTAATDRSSDISGSFVRPDDYTSDSLQPHLERGFRFSALDVGANAGGFPDSDTSLPETYRTASYSEKCLPRPDWMSVPFQPGYLNPGDGSLFSALDVAGAPRCHHNQSMDPKSSSTPDFASSAVIENRKRSYFDDRISNVETIPTDDDPDEFRVERPRKRRHDSTTSLTSLILDMEIERRVDNTEDLNEIINFLKS